MILTVEEENFIRILVILIEIIPTCMRELYEKKKEKDQSLWDQIVAKAPDKKIAKVLCDKIKFWDITALCYALLNCNLDETVRNHLNHLRDIRNKFYGHACDMLLTTEALNNLSESIKCIVKELFGEEAENKINKMITSPLTEDQLEKRKNFIKVSKMLVVAMAKHLRSLVFSVNADELDTQVLCKHLLNSKQEKKRPIKSLLKIRNTHAHAFSMELDDGDFELISNKVKDIAKQLFGKEAEEEIDAIINS